MNKSGYLRKVLGIKPSSLSWQKDTFHHFRWWIIASLALANILVFLTIGLSLSEIQKQYQLRALSLAQNVANAIDQNVSSSIEKVDISLFELKKAAESQIGSKQGLDRNSLMKLMDELEMHLPEVENYRITNADGDVILGRLIDPRSKYSAADRDYFLYHQHLDDGSLQISKPIMGRIVNKPIVTLSRRLNYPDGRFAGVVYATISTDFFYDLLRSYDIGANGSLVLRDKDLGLISRSPPRDGPAGKVGETIASPELHQDVDRGLSSGTILSSHGPDGISRIVSYHRLATVPMMVIAAVSPRDYLAGFVSHIYLELLIALVFLGISIVFGYLIFRAFNESRSTQESLHATLESLQNEKQRNVALMASSNDAIIGKDLGGNISSWNNGAQKIGYP